MSVLRRVATALRIVKPVTGVDYSYARPNPGVIARAGKTFVARYLSSDPGKRVNLREALGIWASNLALMLVWEDSAQSALGGYSAGRRDAVTALGQARSLGWPADRPIYFAVDFDVTGSHRAVVVEYFRGAASILGPARVGVYGGHDTVGWVLGSGWAKWAWQTFAWSRGQWHPGAQVRQVPSAGPGVAGTDADVAVAKDFGAWRPGHAKPAPKPAPKPVPKPAPRPVPAPAKPPVPKPPTPSPAPPTAPVPPAVPPSPAPVPAPVPVPPAQEVSPSWLVRLMQFLRRVLGL